tara:strand:- start:2700 stop:2864 length:165 start_codon:yes stop_codon:yes gene_type:complete
MKIKTELVKAEVSPETKLMLVKIAQKEKRSLKKQIEYILEYQAKIYETNGELDA